VFGIRLILHRGLRYALVSRGFLMFEGIVIFLALFLGAGPVVGTLSPAADPKIASVGMAVATLVLLRGVSRVNQRVLPAIDRHFFREAYNVQQILTDLSRAVRRLASRPDQLLTRITDEISTALHPDQVAIFLTEGPWPYLRPLDLPGPACWEGVVAGKRERFVLYVRHESARKESGKVQAGMALAARLPLARYLASAVRDPDTLDVTPVDTFQRFEGFSHGLAGAGPCLEDWELFERFDARLLVPLVTGGRVLGFLVLGEKLSEEPYSAENKELLLTVAEQVAIALDYSQLIGQVAEQAMLEPGDLLTVFSDGVTDAMNAEGELFGEERLISAVSRHREFDGVELTRRVLEEVDRFVGAAPQQDDITFIAARVE
jgi:sigma-B regulation protein RsbU (phosphoserine phosphatase)